MQLHTAHIYSPSGDIVAIWTGGPYIQVHSGADDQAMELINLLEIPQEEFFFPTSAEEMTKFVVDWLCEYRGVDDITGSRCETLIYTGPAWDD